MAEALQSMSTESFPLFLREAGISLAVSTYQAGKLILMREDNGGLNTHFIAMDKPMGIALADARLAVGTGPYVVDHYNMPAVAEKVEPFGRHDACYLPRELHVTGDIDIHEMSFGKRGELWLVNTKMSCLCTLKREHSVIPRWRPPFITAYDLTDRCHLNGLAMKDGEPYWVTALGTSNEPAGWRQNKAFGGMLMQVKTGKMLCEGLSMPHSPRWHDNKLWVLESGAGALLRIEPHTGEKTLIAEMPGFCRGFDFVGRYAIIGLSQVRETAVFAGLPLTERCDERQCGVYIIDTVTGDTVAYMVFTGGVQEIFAVQVLPARYPALLELNHPLVHTSYSLPDEALQEVIQPDEKQVGMEQAMALYQSDRKAEAIDAWRAVAEEDDGNTQAWYFMGVALSDLERWDEAIEVLNKVVEREPGHAEAWNSMGHAYAGKLDDDHALACYEKAIAADQQYSTAQFNRGLLLLKRGDFAEGWKGYEARWGMPTFTPFECPQPQWRGEDISDKTLLVHTEQGNGDAIQFARFLKMARARCKKLILVCTEPLRLLLREVDGVDEVRQPGSLPGDLFDVYCPIMSLAGIFHIDLDNLPADTPYLTVPKEVVAPALTDNGKRKIGLVWQGSATHANDAHRSLPADTLFALTDEIDADFYSLQLPASAQDRESMEKHGVTDLEPELASYAHTAALAKQMDLIISVDTSVAHLAAALDIPTWILIAANSDWRWLTGREDTPWYPAARLFRQEAPGEWDAIMLRLREAAFEEGIPPS